MPRRAYCWKRTPRVKTAYATPFLRSDGRGAEYLRMQGGGSLNPPSHETVDAKMHYLEQDGKPVFKAAVTSMADVSYEIMERNGLTADDVSWLVPHQANLRIIDATAKRMGVVATR